MDSGLGHDPRKEEQGAFHLPRGTLGLRGLSRSTGRAPPPRPAASSLSLFLAPPLTLDGLALVLSARMAREHAEAEGQSSSPSRERVRRRLFGARCRRESQRSAGGWVSARVLGGSAPPAHGEGSGRPATPREPASCWRPGVWLRCSRREGSQGLPSPACRLAWGSGAGRGNGGGAAPAP